MRKKMKQTVKETVIGFAIGAGLMGSVLWVGLGMHFPEAPETVAAAAAEREYPELLTMDRDEMSELRAGACVCEGDLLDREDNGADYAEAVEVITEPSEEPPAEAYSASDLDLLAAIVYAEAGDQDFIGQRLVADVVLNRVASPAWPNTVSGVVYQPGQFSPVTDGGLDRAWGNVSDSCYEAARLALAGDRIDTQVIYFSMYGCANGVFAFQHGDHYFGY